jgi:hypothetical protein
MFKKCCRIEIALLLFTSHQTVFYFLIFNTVNIFTVVGALPPSKYCICLCRRQTKTLTLLTLLLDTVTLCKQFDTSSYQKSDGVQKKEI